MPTFKNILRTSSLTTILTLVIILNSWSQVTFSVKEFSKDYYGKVYISDTNEVFSEGWVAIYESSNNTEIIRVEAEELTYELIEDSIAANILELPYGLQSNIIYEDFNFDGIKDLAIMDGYFSCYHGPSFKIYIYQDNQFKFNEAFTDLAQNYCGMFMTDTLSKTIHTMTKSGCCWHQYSTFKVKDYQPYPIKVLEIGISDEGVTQHIVSQEWMNNEKIIEEFEIINHEFIDDLIFSMTLKNGATISLYGWEGNIIYFYENIDKQVELSYMNTFEWYPDEQTLKFIHQDGVYYIHENGIGVEIKNKKYYYHAINDKNLGNFHDLKKTHWNNLKIISSK